MLAFPRSENDPPSVEAHPRMRPMPSLCRQRSPDLRGDKVQTNVSDIYTHKSHLGIKLVTNFQNGSFLSEIFYSTTSEYIS